jgi:pimeloyl-ACP methyl ester carboxylesterase
LPDPDTQRLASHGIDVVTIANAGHGMALDNPAGVAQAMIQTLDVPAASG